MPNKEIFILQKRYEIINKIASGGMAEVYRAHDLFLDRVVAVKILNQKANENLQILKKFYKEVDATTRIRHDNIVEVYDIFEQNGCLCIVLELIEGYTLKDRLLRTGPLAIKECLQIFQAIIAGVEIAHKNKIVHRDLKPENILISFDGKIKVSDFGIAIIFDDQKTKQNKIVGTAKYISPECVQSLPMDYRSDIYSLGIVLFELLTGSSPFNGQNPALIAVKHVREPLPSPRSINPKISLALENLVIKATAKNCVERYQDLQELKTDLDLIINQSNNETKVKPLKLKNCITLKKDNKIQKLFVRNRLDMMPFFISLKFLIFIVVIALIILIIVGLLLMVQI